MIKLLVILISFNLSCINSEKENTMKDDYLLVDKIVKQTKEQNLEKTLILSLDNNNEYVISIINKLYKSEIEGDIFKLDSLKQTTGIVLNYPNEINKTKSLNMIFNKNEYEYLISQKESSKWDFNLINETYFEKDNNKSHLKIKISKPIYTLDSKFALIYIYKQATSGIMIYKKTKEAWLEYRLIAPSLNQPKAEKFNYYLNLKSGENSLDELFSGE